MFDYDIIIIGGGISGLFCGYNLIDYYDKILVIEKDTILGGRIKTMNEFKKYNVKYEAGAGRFNLSQKKLIDLLKKMDLYNYRIKNTKDKIFLDKQYCENINFLLNFILNIHLPKIS